jgi:hypothetical protein
MAYMLQFYWIFSFWISLQILLRNINVKMQETFVVEISALRELKQKKKQKQKNKKT